MYFGSKISNNISETPEGYLICRNVPIGRTGYMEYLGEEIGDTARTGEKIKVYRDEEELFSKATMASFEGKIVTNEHPPDLLTNKNSQRYSKGTIQNVRRSKDEPDLLLADLIIYEKKLIDEVQDGKREVSSGYDCIYTENEDGSYTQTNIRGNHVAVVEAGRAGYRVCIKDSIIKEREVDIMTEKSQNKKKNATARILAAMGLKHFAQDAEPEDLADVVDSYSNESGDNVEPAKEEVEDNEVSEIGALSEKLDKLITLIQASLNPGDEENPEEVIDEIIEKIESNDEDESEVVEDEELEEGEVSDPVDRPENPIPNADSKAWATTLKAMKPVIAAIENPTERKKACDSLIAEYKKATQTKVKTNPYADIINAQKKKAEDSKAKSEQDKATHYENLGEEIAKKHNANLKGGK